ncbi:MAG: NADPH:quinone oxidoreductase family protein [Pseudomonadales bacterium]|nr:NADPH:quinone oxidoreductase family protein [Pseudomonadales bacterium]MBO6564457.1 NADPH:quinone oxidoreductase family protein [Pseudomonadales bacterium]MBO6594509.1 NADPH:quinone oxidoreductase family protein [Pseudomonadales bacterium]MBO6656686.1 NADPH:quinone oxidoreductase family protein [Pseudomonadales bacterium]MBO6701012.1 NADPH:quinone oxidoreductase family protein [Pseudomonadales bacterium]
MRAIVCESFASPDGLAVSEVETPGPAANQVLIKIEATGLGYVDALMVAGLYQIKPPLPFVPGNEVAGVIEAAGDDIKHLRAGQRVLATPSNGGLAEYMVLEESRCTPIPDSLSSDDAASFLVNYCTAFHGFNYCGKLKEKENVLILGASGGVGVAAIDVAKAMGARVIAAASSKKKRDACLEAGADDVVNYNSRSWRDDLKKILDGEHLDVVYDPVGGDYAEPALRSLGPDGRFLVVGFASGDIPKFPVNLTLLKRCSVIGVNWGGHIAANPSVAKEVLNTLMQWISQGKISPRSGEAFKLKDTGKAMMKMLNRKAIGKVVIHPQQ